MDKHTENKQYLTPKELAGMLRVDITTVYGWTSDRVIPYIKIGRLVRFDPVKIANWLKQKSVLSSADFS
jgi:excisionase family DNA binding protein